MANKLKSYISSLYSIGRRHKYLVLAAFILILAIITTPYGYTYLTTKNIRYDFSTTSVNKIPFHQVAIVFGAGILPNGSPSLYLQYRVETAVDLYKAHRVNILLMSGDNSTATHNEPLVMKNYAEKLGVPAKAIVVDDAGFDTYDTCYRAKAIFSLTDATLVSQGYHLPRAITTCGHLGVQNIGVDAIHPTRDYSAAYIIREFFSTDKMVFQLIFKPSPTILGKPLPILLSK